MSNKSIYKFSKISTVYYIYINIYIKNQNYVISQGLEHLIHLKLLNMHTSVFENYINMV